MKTLLLLPVAFLCSCTGYMHEAHSASGNYVRDVLVKVGGSASLRGSDGSSIVTDDQQSFRDLTTAIGAVAATNAAKAVSVAKEATTQHAASQGTIQARDAANAALAREALKNSGQPVEAGSSVLNNGQVLTAP